MAGEQVGQRAEDALVEEEGFRGPQVCKIVGITYRQLDYWARTGLLRPSISEARGSGTQRRYSYRDLVELKVITRLLDAGVSLRSTRRAIQCLRDNLGEDVASANLVLAESASVLATTGEQVVDLLRGGQGVLNIVPLAGVMKELDAAVADFAEAGRSRAGRQRAGQGASESPAATAQKGG
ncbi:MAG: MerR family transcriptional regulator [Acidimicrobiales bacterium]|nr:MerR family transcriptional regulator [Acidimicrobiales bacterium]MBO0887050.1 MerR family transcriptional regulator [Acidimicrobiales bacterium]MBO0894503.1 MerR family transcriptional regulator [Acidimicrobiales bacterium]